MGWNPIKDIKKAAKNVAKAVEKGAKDVGKTAEKAAQDAGKTAEKAAQDTGKAVEKAAQDTGKTVEKAAQDTGKTVEKAAQDTGKTVEKAAQDTGKTIEKAFQDTGNELHRAGINTADAAVAVGNFAENQARSMAQTLTDAEKRILEGKIVDAIWHMATDSTRYTEENFGTAISESSLLNNVATAAASIYGGPIGAAAYAAWYTYKQTGDLELALKSGVIAGATAKSLSMVNGLPSNTTDQFTKKVLASASIGAAAVAASGGEEKDIIEGFVKGAALTAAREHYKNMTAEEIEGRAPTKRAIPKPKLDPSIEHEYTILRDESGQPILDSTGKFHQIDIRSLPRDASHVGLATTNRDAGFFSETSTPMQTLAKLPYMNDMAYFHDQWAAVAKMEGVMVQATIVPAIILTVSGTDTPLINQTTEEIEEDATAK
ncbi:hypothetical protein MN202_04820 [Rheinheimera muenzenbergensis]|uniref:Uncharacterized protein n=1 Tax=Rheinheimera muenzenbergensis TaxID=1193628 RepID=A0ABU8C3P4_9GAMM